MLIEMGTFEIPSRKFNHEGRGAKYGSIIEHFICFDMVYKDKKMMKVDCESDKEAGSVFRTLRMKINGSGKRDGKYKNKYDVKMRGTTVYVIRRDNDADKKD